MNEIKEGFTYKYVKNSHWVTGVVTRVVSNGGRIWCEEVNYIGSVQLWNYSNKELSEKISS